MQPLTSNTDWPNLRAFAEWYLSGWPRFAFAPPEKSLRTGAGSTGAIIFRRGAFQAELVRFSPGHVVPPHSHPAVSSYDIHLEGSGLIELGGRMLRPRSPTTTDPLRARIPVLAGVVHSGEAGPDGARFLSLQHWHAGAARGFIIDDWRPA